MANLNDTSMSKRISDTDLRDLYELQVYTTELLRRHLKAFGGRKRNAHPTQANIVEASGPGRDPFGGLSDRTIASYRRRSNQLLNDAHEAGEDVWKTLRDKASNKNSYRTGRAAIQACVMHDMIAAKRQVDYLARRLKAQEITGEEQRGLSHFISSLATYARVLETMPQELPPGMLKGGQQSKSRSIRDLPSDWRELLAERLKPATAVQWLVEASTGCRPEEIAMGITVELSDDRREITFEIKGAKFNEFAGQERRRFSVPADEGPARMLAERLERPGIHVVSLDITPGAYSKRVWRISRKLWPRRSAATTPTPYSARHQMKANLRAAGVPKADTAKVLGHSTTQSQNYYGGRGGSSGAVAPAKIEASREVKVKAGYVAKAKSTKVAATSKSTPSPAAKARRRSRP